MRGPILREQFFGWRNRRMCRVGQGEPKERGNHHAERETAQEQL